MPRRCIYPNEYTDINIVQHNDKFLLTQLLSKLWLTSVSTDYKKYFARKTLGWVLKKLKLTLNRSFDRQADTKN